MIEKLQLEWNGLGFYQRLVQTVRIVQGVYRTVDQVLDELVQAEVRKRESPTSCAGCRMASCCHQIVYASAVEAFLITKGLRSTKWDSEDGDVELLELGDKQQEASARDWLKTGTKCPFVTYQGSCLIYPYRPLACRWHYVWGSAENCTPKSVLQHGPVMGMNATTVILSAVPVFYRLQKLWGWGPATGTLPTMVGTLGEAIREGLDTHLDEYISYLDPRPPVAHGITLAGLWPGVDLKAEKRRAKSKRRR